MNDNYFESEENFGDFDLGNTEEVDYNPFEEDEQAEPAPTPRFSEVKQKDYSRETEIEITSKPERDMLVGATHENPFTAALSKAEDEQAKTDAGSLFSKLPVFEYGGAVEEITNASISFEQLRIDKSTDFPELEDGKKISWAMEYGSIKKPIKKIPNNSIPFILLVCSWGLGIIVLGISPTVIIQGIVATGVAVLADNIRKIVTPKREGD